MKNIRLFTTKKAYEQFVLKEAFGAPMLTGNPFYRRLIGWVIDNRTPLFFEQSDPGEHDSFSLYWSWILLRGTYTDPLRRGMYMLHEFAHSLFPYPQDLPRAGQQGFKDACLRAEYAASSETEVLAHWRVKGLRENFLQGMRIWYDLLRDDGMTRRPTAAELLRRRRAIMQGRIPAGKLRADRAVLAVMRSYEVLNERWTRNHWKLWKRMPVPETQAWPALDTRTYERTVAVYRRRGGQKEYEANVLANVRTMFFLHGLANKAPATFKECFRKVKLLEGRVLPNVSYRS